MQDDRPYINVDTTTEAGIQRAHQLGFQAIPQLANVVISPLILDATGYLFTRENKAMLFALLRHPVERAVSQFYYLQGATWGKWSFHSCPAIVAFPSLTELIEPTYNTMWASMTLMDYIQSDFVESDWMVRFLVGKPTGPVDEHDLNEAKSILRDKCWIGLQNRMNESVNRFGAIFRWNQHPKWSSCVDEFQGSRKRSNSNAQKQVVKRDREEWDILAQINALDMKLFAYAHQLYNEQGRMYFSIQRHG